MTLIGDAVDSGGSAAAGEYGGAVGAGAFKPPKSGSQRLDKDNDDGEANAWVATIQAAVCTQRLGRRIETRSLTRHSHKICTTARRGQGIPRSRAVSTTDSSSTIARMVVTSGTARALPNALSVRNSRSMGASLPMFLQASALQSAKSSFS